MRRGVTIVTRAAWFGMVAVAVLGSSTRAEEKLILLDDVPRDLSRFTVAPDGSTLYFAASKFLVFNASGRLVDRIGVPQGACRGT